MIPDQVERNLLVLPTLLKYPYAELIGNTIEKGVSAVLSHYRIIRFNNRLMVEVDDPYVHFQQIDKNQLVGLIRPLIPNNVSLSRINDIVACISNIVQDLSVNSQFVLFGKIGDKRTQTTVWDMDSLRTRNDVSPNDCVWRSPYVVPTDRTHKPDLVMKLAGGDQELYSDIIQSLAPLLMNCKPLGNIWWAGTDPIKRLLQEALHLIFPAQLTAITPKRLTAGRLTYLLNNVIGNVVAEECGLRVEDFETCKLIGKREDFFVHKFHSQDGLTINGNVHHIFSVSDIASISNRHNGRCGQTFVVPFNEQINADRTQTISSEFCGQLITEMCRYALRIKQQGYQYEWSNGTLALNEVEHVAG